MIGENLLGPEPTLLPDMRVSQALAHGTAPADVVRAHPGVSPRLGRTRRTGTRVPQGRDVEAYAYARVGYHRGLDSLRKAGWNGSYEGTVAYCAASLHCAKPTISEDEELTRPTDLPERRRPLGISELENA